MIPGAPAAAPVDVAPARRAPPARKGPYRKPRVDVYTWMLALALVAILISCVCLFLEVQDYGEEPYKLSLSAPLTQESPVVAAEGCGPQGPYDPGLPPCPATSIHG